MKKAGFLRRYSLPFAILIIFGVLFAFTIRYLLQESRTITDRIIVEDVVKLAAIFKHIDDECKIMGFDHQKNDIDFLTVEKFVSSEIGSMNLMLPKKWHGPYIDDNPAVQAKVYQVVRTNKGYFIVPGDGVHLNNGKVVGKDIVLDEQADIEKLAHDPQALEFNGMPMAVQIQVSGVSGGRLLDALIPEGV